MRSEGAKWNNLIRLCERVSVETCEWSIRREGAEGNAACKKESRLESGLMEGPLEVAASWLELALYPTPPQWIISLQSRRRRGRNCHCISIKPSSYEVHLFQTSAIQEPCQHKGFREESRRATAGLFSVNLNIKYCL